ncbi:hypothetical protein SAMN05216420_11641 [Nitrosospira sp. Nl5]|uniref:hypothetical protein n=1 Tax=Nitrosospira sp. Nl5 TaxID=200120 RepID=UPI00088A72C7|nr:hypothetical protein [Nitrosospira sp. Nl5]SCY74947.1 hypothetical protein SAMN05216420_11641 [Nitrosospira sp. Nl5]
MSKSKRATAPAFLVISADHPRYTDYTGTKDQIISLGLALDHDFPVAPKRLTYGWPAGGFKPELDFQIRKIKGGRFQLRRWHEERKQDKRIIEEFRIFPSPKADCYRTQWRGMDGDDEARDKVDRIVEDVHHMFVEERKRSLRKKITLVKPGQTTESFISAFPEERRGNQ